MNRLRRAWAVLADPPASDFAFFLRNFALPVGAVLFVARLLLGPLWGPGLPELVWMVVALAVTRQRDAARRAVSASQDVQPLGHADRPQTSPEARTVPRTPQSEDTTHHRNEDR